MAKKRPVHEPIVESLAIAVPPDLAWDALTSPRHLGAVILGHVELEPVPGKPFVWTWDILAAAAPGKPHPNAYVWRGKILDAVPGSTLVLGGKGESFSVLTVKGQGGASLVTVTQGVVPPPLKFEEYRYAWADFLLRLKTRLEGPPAMDSLYFRTLIRAKPADVVRALLSSRVMSQILPVAGPGQNHCKKRRPVPVGLERTGRPRRFRHLP
jgi:hypothetical protein